MSATAIILLDKNAATGTGTLVLGGDEVAFARWRPSGLLRIQRSQIVSVDTATNHLGRTVRSDVLRIRWSDPGTAEGTDCAAFFVRDLDEWLTALGGTRTPPASDGSPAEHT